MTQPSTPESIYFAALNHSDPEDRSRFLDQACANDAGLRQRIQAMLEASQGMGSFLEKPLAQGDATREFTSASQPEDASAQSLEKEGSILGPYKLVQLLGEGGMGSVWLAEQDKPVKRKVALKIVKAGMDSARVIARFEAERQALALMDHTNIAKVFDAGRTETGRPYFVMELVKGLPITQYCDHLHVSIEERLVLFIQVCQAVQHAHQKGIIHRDIKPSNVLVAVQDGKPVPKVIDFGVAKAIHTKLGEKTLDTELGAVIGTLEYMAPEQAELSALDIDTRADLYALGVLLYELLTGTTPIQRNRLREAGFTEMIRIIKEEEPPKPSTRLSESKESIASLAAQRRTEPGRLAKLICGDLDWIVLKTLEKDRTRRYESVNGLARDIERYLANEPVEACPPSRSYRLKKFLARNRGTVAAAALILVAVLVGLAGTSLGMIQARVARDEEAKQREVAQKERDEKETARAEEEKQRKEAERLKEIANEQTRAAKQARDGAETALYFNRINLAHQYWIADSLIQSQGALALCPPERRSWEWHYLDRINHPELFQLPGNGQFTTLLRICSDGQRLVAFASSGFSGVRVWDLITRKAVCEIDQAKNGKSFVCFDVTRDGKWIALAERNGVIGLWNATTGEWIRELVRCKKSPNSLSFSPDGKLLAAAFSDGRPGERLLAWTEPPRNEDLIVWEVETGKERFHPKGFGLACQFSPDGSRLLAYRRNPGIRLTAAQVEFATTLFDITTWKEIQPEVWGPSTSFGFSGDGKKLALGWRDRISGQSVIKIFDPATGKIGKELVVPELNDLELNHDGSFLAHTRRFGNRDIIVFDLVNNREPATLRGHTEPMNSLQFSPDGMLFSCSWDNTIRCWNPGQPQDHAVIGPSKFVYAVPGAFAPGGKWAAYGQSQSVGLFVGAVQGITLVDGATGKTLGTLAGHKSGTIQFGFTEAGDALVSGGRDGTVKVWRMPGGSQLSTFTGHKGEIQAVALHGSLALGASTDESPETTRARFGQGNFKIEPVDIKVWNPLNGLELRSLKGHQGGVSQLAFGKKTTQLASYGYRAIKLWDAQTGQHLRDLEYPKSLPSVEWIAFGEDDRVLLAKAMGQFAIWDTASGRLRRQIAMGSPNGREKVAVSLELKRVALASMEQVKVWDLDTGLEIITLKLPNPPVRNDPKGVAALTWTADGSRLRALLEHGGMIEWNGSPRTPAAKVTAWAPDTR